MSEMKFIHGALRMPSAVKDQDESRGDEANVSAQKLKRE